VSRPGAPGQSPPAWAELAWPDVADAVARHPVALLPIGAVEEHGPHLPLGTDWYAADDLAQRLAVRAGLIRLPALPYGQVWSLEHFNGSLSIRDETLVAIVCELAAGLARAGVRGLVLLSAHLGNAAAMKRAARALAEEGSIAALPLTYPGLAEVERLVAESSRSHPTIMHADEMETSILLALRPEAVDMSRAAAEYPDYPADFEVAPIRWDTLSSSGVFGDPTRASAEKGEQIVAHVTAVATKLIYSWRERMQL